MKTGLTRNVFVSLFKDFWTSCSVHWFSLRCRSYRNVLFHFFSSKASLILRGVQDHCSPVSPEPALTISVTKEESLKLNLDWGDCVCPPGMKVEAGSTKEDWRLYVISTYQHAWLSKERLGLQQKESGFMLCSQIHYSSFYLNRKVINTNTTLSLTRELAYFIFTENIAKISRSN